MAIAAKERYELQVNFDKSIIELCQRYCAQPEVAMFGYRSIRDFVKSHIIPPLNGKLLDRSKSSVGLRVLATEDGINVEDI